MRSQVAMNAALVLYLAGAIVTYGHFVSRSDACGRPQQEPAVCASDRVAFGFFVAVGWPFYWSVQAWER